MKRVAIVGSPGSGKSTLAQNLALALGFEHVELDSLFHRPDWEPTPVPEFRAAVAAALSVDRWVVDGNYRPVSDITAGWADTIVWLDLSRPVVTSRVVRRTIGRIGRRAELWNGNRESLRRALSRDPEKSIIVWTWQKHAHYRELYGSQLEGPLWSGSTVVRLRTRREVRDWLAGAVASSSP
ncbi:MAG: AAA family ATPase [Acidimicrobiia bacterium]|nr:AAA family ATPase [Acidimicrobiia bacterium]